MSVDEIVAALRAEAGLNGARITTPMLRRIAEHLDAIGVELGPQAFTGAIIGYMVARGAL